MHFFMLYFRCELLYFRIDFLGRFFAMFMRSIDALAKEYRLAAGSEILRAECDLSDADHALAIDHVNPEQALDLGNGLSRYYHDVFQRLVRGADPGDTFSAFVQ